MNRRRCITTLTIAIFLAVGAWLWIALPDLINRFHKTPDTVPLRLLTRPRTKRQAAHAQIRGRLMILEHLKRDGIIRYPTPEEWEEGMSAVPPDKSADPWGTPYRYELVDGKPKLTSAGRDQTFGTRDDITN